ncbi:MAG TPA: alcohol dehydrogenase, partial [Rhodobacteraceae bacterium]|nr:alcohol dehydrogenase [Paracoccaceae bacterium]
MPSEMSGVVLTKHGGPEALVWRDNIPVPSIGSHEVLVRVLAAGINNADINTPTGWYAPDDAVDEGGWSGVLKFPRIQGGDICGRIVAIGAAVSRFEIGQRVTCPLVMARPTAENLVGCIVLGSEIDGGFAQYCKIEARDLHNITGSPLSDAEIAAIPCAFGTAENMLRRVGVAAGQSVLISGASGGVGLAAVQLACLRGAVVTGICSEAKFDAVRAAGASAVLARNTPLPASAYDVVIDMVGGPAWPAMISAL